MHRLTRTALALIAIATAAPLAAQQPQTPAKPAPADAHAQMNMRGADVMGFDQEKTSHHFYLYADGGAIDVSANDAADTTNRDAVRAHLPHVAMMFGMGDFSAPMLVHATDVPGTKDMAAMKDKLSFAYVETPNGGRVNITTCDAAALDALHKFLRFQIADHKTGDSGKIEPRRK